MDLIALNEALAQLEQEDPRKADLVKLRYFAGFTIPASAEILGIAVATAITDWAYAKAWLHWNWQTRTEPPFGMVLRGFF